MGDDSHTCCVLCRPIQVNKQRLVVLAWRSGTSCRKSSYWQYIIPTNHACMIVTHARCINGVYLTCASLYCCFTLSPAIVHIARPLCYRSWVRSVVVLYFFSYLLLFLSHFLLYYCHSFSLTSISVIIYICWPYESSISMRHINGRYDFLIFC